MGNELIGLIGLNITLIIATLIGVVVRYWRKPSTSPPIITLDAKKETPSDGLRILLRWDNYHVIGAKSDKRDEFLNQVHNSLRDAGVKNIYIDLGSDDIKNSPHPMKKIYKLIADSLGENKPPHEPVFNLIRGSIKKTGAGLVILIANVDEQHRPSNQNYWWDALFSELRGMSEYRNSHSLPFAVFVAGNTIRLQHTSSSRFYARENRLSDE